jgi:hypothetical protein
MSTADLAKLLGNPGTSRERIRFDGEGRWQSLPERGR